MIVPVRRMALSPIVVPGYPVFPKNSRDGKPRITGSNTCAFLPIVLFPYRWIIGHQNHKTKIN